MSVGFAWWGNPPLLPARQTVDECREVPSQTGNATSPKRQPCRLTRSRSSDRVVWKRRESRPRKDGHNPINVPAPEAVFSGVGICFFETANLRSSTLMGSGPRSVFIAPHFIRPVGRAAQGGGLQNRITQVQILHGTPLSSVESTPRNEADSDFTGMGVERYTPVFQTGVQGAIP